MQEHDGWRAIDRVSEAEEALAVAVERLHRAQLEAVLGIHYDDFAYDQAVLEYRRATRDLTTAVAAGRRWQDLAQRLPGLASYVAA